jgi:glutathione S-transferase
MQQPVLVEGDKVVIDDVELLRALTRPAAGTLYPEGPARAAIDEWFAKSCNLAGKISEWLLSSAETPCPVDGSVMPILETAESALQKASYFAGDKMTAADAAFAASAAGFFFCVRNPPLVFSYTRSFRGGHAAHCAGPDRGDEGQVPRVDNLP